MAIYDVEVDFIVTRVARVEADTPESASIMVETATDDQICHLVGKSYAQASEAVRIVKNITEVV